MKWSIWINQYALADSKLDLKDAAILSWLIHFCGPDDKNVKQMSFSEGGKDYRYTWINFTYLIKEMPLLRVKGKASISERLAKIAKEGYIKTFQAPDRSIYVRLTEKVKELDTYPEGIRKTEQGIRNSEQEVFEKPNSTIRILPNNTPTEGLEGKPVNQEGKAVSPVQRVIQYYFKSCINLRGFKPVVDGGDAAMVKRRLLEGHKIEDLMEEIAWFLESKQSYDLTPSLKVALSSAVMNRWLAQRE